MGNVAKLFPYRDSNGRLGFRGKVGCKKADGVTEGVSKFFPVRVDGRMLLRGKGPDGKILWGFPYRDENGRLMARTILTAGPVVPPRCEWVTACGLSTTYNVTISGSECNGVQCAYPYLVCFCNSFNGTFTLELDQWCVWRADIGPFCQPYYTSLIHRIELYQVTGAWEISVSPGGGTAIDYYRKARSSQCESPTGSYAYYTGTAPLYDGCFHKSWSVTVE
jgi:hypothetical protein